MIIPQGAKNTENLEQIGVDSGANVMYSATVLSVLLVHIPGSVGFELRLQCRQMLWKNATFHKSESSTGPQASSS
jgi:hypothetical protein